MKKKKMSYAEFINEVANKTNISENIIRNVFDEGAVIIGKNAYDGKEVEIRNFGIFKTKKAQGRKVQLNNVSNFDSYTKFQFKPSSHFTKRHRIAIGEIKK